MTAGTPRGGDARSAQAERRRGYARWKGERSAGRMRWWVIARGSLSLAWSSRWVKVLVISSFVPGVILFGLTYLFIPLSATLLDDFLDVTAFFTFLVAAVVGARLVADDRRQGGFLAHFSRPVTRADYVLGKAVALFVPLLIVSTTPLLGIVGDASVDSDRFTDRIARGVPPPDDPGVPEAVYLRETSYGEAALRVLAYGVAISAATTGIVLGLSSLTTRARTAGIAWFAIVALGEAAREIVQDVSRLAWPALFSWLDTLRDLSTFILDEPIATRDLPDYEYGTAVRLGVLAVAAVAGLAAVDFQLRRAEGGAR